MVVINSIKQVGSFVLNVTDSDTTHLTLYLKYVLISTKACPAKQFKCCNKRYAQLHT